MNLLAAIILAASAAAPASQLPSAWEQNVDRPTVQVNTAANAVRGMESGNTCMLARELFERFGGTEEANQCRMAFETGTGTAYYSYCDRKASYVVQIDFTRCTLEELPELRDQRLTGTAILDARHGKVLFSHFYGSYLYPIGTARPARFFSGAALFSKHEFYRDAQFVYLLNTLGDQPVLDRISLAEGHHTRVRLGDVSVLDFQKGRILVRSRAEPGVFGLYDSAARKFVQRWRTPGDMRARLMGDGWVAFWRPPAGERRGDWILVEAASGHSVFHGWWNGPKLPKFAWRGKALYAGERKIFGGAGRPLHTPVRPMGATRRAGS